MRRAARTDDNQEPGCFLSVCPECKKEFNQTARYKIKYGHPKIFCSLKCVGRHVGREGFRRIRNASKKYICEFCTKEFNSYYNNRKFCSRKCFGLFRSLHGCPNMYYKTKIDKNQKAIVEALEAAGASVLVTSRMGSGFPDLVVGLRGKNILIEVKNPENSYGRKGFNKNQQNFADFWRGSPPIIVRTVDEAMAAIHPRL